MTKLCSQFSYVCLAVHIFWILMHTFNNWHIKSNATSTIQRLIYKYIYR